jgi:trans-aconitate methyltransferase
MYNWNPEEYAKHSTAQLAWARELIEGLAAWIRTTWLPFTERVPESKREEMIQEVAKEYVKQFPPDARGNIHVKMVRLEVAALKP